MFYILIVKLPVIYTFLNQLFIEVNVSLKQYSDSFFNIVLLFSPVKNSSAALVKDG